MQRDLEKRRVLENIGDIRKYAESIILAQGRIIDSVSAIFKNDEKYKKPE